MSAFLIRRAFSAVTLKSSALMRCAPVSTSTRLLADTAEAARPVVCSKEPFCVHLIAGKRHSWCTCGLSKKQPLCDGAHKGTGMRPHRFFPEETGDAYLCGCKQTKSPPYCDGSHMEEVVQNCAIGESL